ncbi:MAG TPA: hypothetical protein VGD67_02340 [Pseudonocardiaceae bacterium]
MDLLHGSGGSRLTWERLPAGVRQAVEALVGAPVVAAVSQPGGFSPGVASRVLLGDGRRVFVKAVGGGLDPIAPRLLRKEIRVLGVLPPELPAPRLLAVHDEHTDPTTWPDPGSWVAAVLEDVHGRMPVLPWRPDELARVVDALADLAEAGTPCPGELPRVTDRHAALFGEWRRLAADGHPRLAELPALARARLDDLAALELGWTEAAAGDTLVHDDLRADNILLTEDRVWLVDWPYAAAGAPWLDLVFMLPSVVMQGGADPEAVLAGYPPARDVDPDAVNRVLAAAAGYFLGRSLEPAPPALPRIRVFQRAQGDAALTWLARRLRWPPG